MFDKYTLNPNITVKHNSEITITEKKAPTDDSIRLYKEIKEKAYESILDGISYSNNNISFKAITYREHGFNVIVKLEAKINGTTISTDMEIDGLEYTNGNRVQLINKIIDRLSIDIAKHLVCKDDDMNKFFLLP